MGFYYGPSTPPPKPGKKGKKNKNSDEFQPGGCMEALVITRAAFGALALPLAILFGAMIGLVVCLYLFAIHPLIGVAGIVVLFMGIAMFARWERGRHPTGPPF